MLATALWREAQNENEEPAIDAGSSFYTTSGPREGPGCPYVELLLLGRRQELTESDPRFCGH